MFDHLTGTMHFWYYHAPPDRWHTPRTLEATVEEIEVLVSGRGYFEIDGEPVDCGPGSALWYCPGDVVRVRSHESDPYETIVFRFSVTALPPVRPPAHSVWADWGECVRFCREALALFNREGEPPRETVFCHYARLIWEARQFLRRQRETAAPAGLVAALEFVERNRQRPIGVAEIADAAGVSQPHLTLLFRRWRGVSPMQYVIRARLAEARTLLVSSRQSVKEVCFAVGFHDVTYFCQRFRRETGLTPGQYRRRFAPRMAECSG